MSRCNEQWNVGTTQREFNSSHMLYLLIGLAFIIVPWNVLLCYISWRCMKITPNTFSLFHSNGILSNTQKCSVVLTTLKVSTVHKLMTFLWKIEKKNSFQFANFILLTSITVLNIGDKKGRMS